jgi:hypothetical protein
MEEKKGGDLKPSFVSLELSIAMHPHRRIFCVLFRYVISLFRILLHHT